MMRNLTCLIGILSFALVSCKKENAPSSNCSPDTYYITSSDLMNCEYKIGSYWIIIDSSTMFIDSVRISKVNHGFSNIYCDKFETHSYMLTSNLPGFDQYAVYAGGLYKRSNAGAYSGIKIYDDYDSPSTITPNETRFDSLFIYDQYYYRVIRTEIENDWTEWHNRSVYYINSEYGLLKHEIYDDNNYRISNKIVMRKNIVH